MTFLSWKGPSFENLVEIGYPEEQEEVVKMSLPISRAELVGKRFLCVCTGQGNKLKLSQIADWPWKSGLIRCATHLDPKDPDLQVQPDSFFLLN